MLIREWQYYGTCDVCNDSYFAESGVTKLQAIRSMRQAGWRITGGGRRCVCPDCLEIKKSGGIKDVGKNRSGI